MSGAPTYEVCPEWAEHEPEFREALPDPNQIFTVADLSKALGEVMEAAGVSSPREVSRRCKDRLPSHTTFRTMLAGERLPSLEVMNVFLRALVPDIVLIPWSEAWHRVCQGLPEIPRQGSIPANKKV